MTAVAVRTLAETPVGDVAVPRLELVEWAERHGIVAGITVRGEGFSLGLWSEESVGTVMTRWRALIHAMRGAGGAGGAGGGRFRTMVLSHQVHGTTVDWHGVSETGWLLEDGIDGHATNQPGILLTVTVADCVPVYLADPGRRAVALLHAGWRGVAGRILEAALSRLRTNVGSSPADVVMHCGIGICGMCYEVGPEVLQALSMPEKGAPAHVDLKALLAAQAAELGIAEVSVSPHCTACEPKRFFSHRASGGRDGRMLAYVGRPLA